jgi:hypothetical protein
VEVAVADEGASPVRTECLICEAPVIFPSTSVRSARAVLCPGCRFELQVKVERAVREVEFEMVNGPLRRPLRRRPWVAAALAALVIAACLVALVEAWR